MLKKPYLLLCTAGRSDLKVCFQDEGKWYQSEVKKRLRAFHEHLITTPGEYRFAAAKEIAQLSPLPREMEVYWDQELGGLVLGKNSEKKDEYQRIFINTPYILNPAKLTDLCCELEKREEPNPSAVLVLNTRRTDRISAKQFKFEEEPIGVGPILARFFGERFGMVSAKCEGDCALGRAGWLDYLSETMTQSGEGRDYPVNRLALQRIEVALRALFEVEPDLGVLLLLDGGIPEFKPVIEAMVRMHCGRERVVRHREHEGKPRFENLAELPPNPQFSFQTRSAALELIAASDFQGAYAVAKELEKDEPEQKGWIEEVSVVASFFHGATGGSSKWPDYLPRIQKDEDQLLFLALRTEAYLRHGLVLEAMPLTCIFFEFASLLLLKAALGERAIIKPLKQVIVIPDPAPKIVHQLIQEEVLDKKDNTTYRYNITNEKSDRLIDLCGESGEKLSLLKPIAAMNEVMRNEKKSIDPRKLRNQYIHRLPSVQDIKTIVDVYGNAGLWRKCTSLDTNTSRYLNQDLIRNILTPLGYPKPKTIYKDIIDGLSGTLRKYSIAAPAPKCKEA